LQKMPVIVELLYGIWGKRERKREWYCISYIAYCKIRK
jgi:hypothetical protein